MRVGGGGDALEISTPNLKGKNPKRGIAKNQKVHELRKTIPRPMT